MSNLKEYALADIENLKIHGRTTGCLTPLSLFWTGSGIELNVKATQLWIEIEAGYDAHEPWIAIVIDGVPVSRFMVLEGKQWICVFKGMNKDVIKNIRIVKETQALNEDPKSFLQIHRVRCDGEFVTVEDRPYKIEFIGDSITSGEGAIGAKKEDDWIMMWFSAIQNYSYMVSEALNADCRIISQSGWGVYTSYDNNPNKSMAKHYEKVCGSLNGELNKSLGVHNENDFSTWQPDLVVINLGTNDEAAFNNPMWKDEVTGKTHKQRKNPDGSFNSEDLAKFEEAVSDFLFKIRTYNRHAHLLWVYGMLGDSMMPAIERGVEAYQLKTGDKNVSVLLLPNTTDETVGARYHPGKSSHKQAAKVIVNHVKKILA